MSGQDDAVPRPPTTWGRGDRARQVRHYEPSDKATLPGRMSVKAVGVQFVDAYPENLHLMARQRETLGIKWTVRLKREPDNPHDSNAVAVVTGTATDDQIGHLPRALAGRIAPELDAGRTWHVVDWRVLVMPGREDNPGIEIDLVRA